MDPHPHGLTIFLSQPAGQKIRHHIGFQHIQIVWVFSSCRLQSTKGTRTGRNATSNFGGTTLPSSSCKAFGHGDVTNVGNQNIGKLSIDYQSNCWFSNWKRGCAMIMLPSNKSMLLIAFWGGSSTNIIRSCSCHNTSGRI